MEEPKLGMFSVKGVIKDAEAANSLLLALLSHPSFNKNNPADSPKPLFFVADFVRTTYVKNFMEVLPKEAVYKSYRLANPYLVQYTDSKPLPSESDTGEDYLNDISNWPKPTPQVTELIKDGVGRMTMACMIILDPLKGALIVGGRFDWKSPVDIEAIARGIGPPGFKP